MGKRDDVDQIRDVVHSAIDGDDILPLVRWLGALEEQA